MPLVRDARNWKFLLLQMPAELGRDAAGMERVRVHAGRAGASSLALRIADSLKLFPIFQGHGP